MLGKVSEGTFASFVDQTLHNLLADDHLVGALGVAGGLNLLGSPLSEGDTEDSQEVSIDALDLDDDLNGGMPFLDDGAELFAGDVHAIEVGETVRALDFFNDNLHLSE